MLDKEKYEKITSEEISEENLKLIWELIKNYLGYDPFYQHRFEYIETKSTKIFLKYGPIKEIRLFTVDKKEIDIEDLVIRENYIDISNVFRKRLYDFYYFPYNCVKPFKIEIDYEAGFNVDEIPEVFYLAGRELLKSILDEGRELTSYSIDTIKKTYATTDRKSRIYSLIGKYRI